MARKQLNNPFVVWGSSFLWLTSIFAVVWSLLLFFSVGDMLLLTGADLINAIVLLSGIIMLPTNVHILYAIANDKKIDHKSKVVCCPLWVCIVWIMVINSVGALLCAEKICTCTNAISNRIASTMKHYRTIPKYRHFIDNIQWSLKCCGLNSFKDWFDYDWYDKIQDYDWESAENRNTRSNNEMKIVTDSVPLSCCKSGSCTSNFLLELGTGSINTRGCGTVMRHILMCSMITHFIMFLIVIIVEAIILKLIMSGNKADLLLKIPGKKGSKRFNIRNIMPARGNFSVSSGSLRLYPEDTDDEEINDRRLFSSRQARTP